MKVWSELHHTKFYNFLLFLSMCLGGFWHHDVWGDYLFYLKNDDNTGFANFGCIPFLYTSNNEKYLA